MTAEELARRLITLIFAGWSRMDMIRRTLPRTKHAGWAWKPFRIEDEESWPFRGPCAVIGAAKKNVRPELGGTLPGCAAVAWGKFGLIRPQLLDVFADFRTAGPAATRRSVAQVLLHSASAIDFTGVHVPVGIDRYHVRPVKLACLAAAGSEST